MVAGMQNPEDRRIVALGTARVEYNFRFMAIEELRHGLAGPVHGRMRLLTMKMDRRGIAKVLHPIRAHGLDHLRQQWGGGICIRIDSSHRGSLLLIDCKGNPDISPGSSQ